MAKHKNIYGASFDAAMQGTWTKPAMIEGNAYIRVNGAISGFPTCKPVQHHKLGANEVSVILLDKTQLAQLQAEQVKLEMSKAGYDLIKPNEMVLARQYAEAELPDMFGIFILYVHPRRDSGHLITKDNYIGIDLASPQFTR